MIATDTKRMMVKYLDGGSLYPLIANGDYKDGDYVIAQGRYRKGGPTVNKDAQIISEATVNDIVSYVNEHGYIPDWQVISKVETALDNGGKLNKVGKLEPEIKMNFSKRSSKQIDIDTEKLSNFLLENYGKTFTSKEIGDNFSWENPSSYIKTAIDRNSHIISYDYNRYTYRKSEQNKYKFHSEVK